MKNSNQLISEVAEICNIYNDAKQLNKKQFEENRLPTAILNMELKAKELGVDFRYIKNIMKIESYELHHQN